MNTSKLSLLSCLLMAAIIGAIVDQIVIRKQWLEPQHAMVQASRADQRCGTKEPIKSHFAINWKNELDSVLDVTKDGIRPVIEVAASGSIDKNPDFVREKLRSWDSYGIEPNSNIQCEFEWVISKGISSLLEKTTSKQLTPALIEKTIRKTRNDNLAMIHGSWDAEPMKIKIGYIYPGSPPGNILPEDKTGN